MEAARASAVTPRAQDWLEWVQSHPDGYRDLLRKHEGLLAPAAYELAVLKHAVSETLTGGPPTAAEIVAAAKLIARGAGVAEQGRAALVTVCRSLGRTVIDD